MAERFLGEARLFGFGYRPKNWVFFRRAVR